MKFDLSSEQKMLQESVDRFLQSELSQQRLMEIFNSDECHVPALWQGIADLGILSILVPESDGGLGMGLLDVAAVVEIMGKHALPGPFITHSLVTLAIVRGGTADQKQKWLPGLISGESIGTIALGEAGNRSQPGDWLMPAGPVLEGGKSNVLCANVADVMLVGVAGGGLQLVDMKDESVQISAFDNLDATRRVFDVEFQGVPAEQLTCNAQDVIDAGAILLAADAYGGARYCIDLAAEYALTRKQFDVVIGQFQAVKHQISNLAVDVEPTQGLYWYAAHAFDAGLPESSRMASIAKAHMTDRYLEAARGATEVHGGIGYTWEYPLHIWLKRAMFNRAFLGMPSVHRARSVALAGWAEAVS